MFVFTSKIPKPMFALTKYQAVFCLLTFPQILLFAIRYVQQTPISSPQVEQNTKMSTSMQQQQNHIEAFWTTSQTQSYSTEVNIVTDAYFDLRGWERSPMEKQRARITIADALTLLKTGRQVLSSMTKPDPTFCKYFPAESFPQVKGVIDQLSIKLGADNSNGPAKHRLSKNAIPIPVYYDTDPWNTPDLKLCSDSLTHSTESIDSADYPITLAEQQEDAIIGAYYLGRHNSSVSTMFLGPLFITICPITLKGHTGGLSDFWTLQDLPCIHEKYSRLTMDTHPTPQSAQQIGFAGAIFLHELFHWTSDQIIDEKFSWRNDTHSAYGKYPTQKLAQLHPDRAATNADNYIYFLLEKFWQHRCSGRPMHEYLQTSIGEHFGFEIWRAEHPQIQVRMPSPGDLPDR